MAHQYHHGVKNLIRNTPADILLVKLGLPRGSGIELIQKARRLQPNMDHILPGAQSRFMLNLISRTAHRSGL